MEERKIIQTLVKELQQLTEGEQCDHDAGICWCATFEALEYAAAWLRQDGFLGPRSLCECGHGGDGYPSNHDDGFGGSPGHGRCKIADCACVQFTFAGFTREFADFRNTATPTLVAHDGGAG